MAPARQASPPPAGRELSGLTGDLDWERLGRHRPAPAKSLSYTAAMGDPPPGQAFRKRLWPKGVAIPDGWQLSEGLTELLSGKYPEFVVICGWFDPTWDEGRRMGRSGQP